jgi:hypothetical protein
MINRLLVIAVIILSLGIAGIIGCTTDEPSSSPSQQVGPKYTPQQIADMQAELQEVEAALAENEKQQINTRNNIGTWQYQAQLAQELANSYSDSSNDWMYSDKGSGRESAMRSSQQAASRYRDNANEQQAILYHLQDEHQELLERKILLMIKLEATQ